MDADRARDQDLAGVKELQAARGRMLTEMKKIIIGQEAVIDQMLITLLANGHCLLVGVPGLAKTLMVSTLARILSLRYNRIQFTPDLMPSDITGTEIIEEEVGTGRRIFKFIRGPVFGNVLLADEINRTPPKTQAALLQAMQEREVTAGGETHPLPLPFFVLATQNPIEMEGTYPLPEAQLDRFMLNIHVDYPDSNEEARIVESTTSAYEAKLEQVLTGEDISRLQGLVRRVPVADHVVQYAVRLARWSRPGDPDAPDFVREWVSWGAGPRASQYLILAAKTSAVLDGRFTPEVEDVKRVSLAVLRHRLVTSFNAEADGIAAPEIVKRLSETVPVSVQE